MKKLKLMQGVFIIIFISVITLPFIYVNKSSNKISQTENRYLAPFPQIYNADIGKLNPHLRGQLEGWFNDNVGFREPLVKLNANIMYKVFNTSPSERVHIGKDDWFFYTQDNNLQIAQGTYPISEETLQSIKEEQEFIQQLLANKGIEYILMLTPSKASIYPEKISGGNYSVRQTPIDIVTDYLRENTTITVVNTKEELIKEKEKSQLFYKTDTHWNEEGGYVGYKSLIKELNNIDILNDDIVDTKRIDGFYKGEFAAMMGDVNLLDEESTTMVEIINPQAQQIQREDLDRIAEEIQQGHNYLSGGNSFFINEDKTKKALIYGDSFLGYRKILNLLAEHFGELSFIWSDKIMNQMIESTQPDVVIFERTERYLYTLGKEADSKLGYDSLVTHSAEVLSHTTPEGVGKDEKYNIDITVKNTSQDTWSERKQVRLCIWQDGQDYGYRIYIPEGVEVKPSEEITFTLQGFVAPPTGNTVLEYQMVEEGITYFGEREQVNIIVQE